MKSQAPAVVKQEQVSGVLCLMIFGTDSQFISDAVSGAHQFGSALVGEFIGL